MKNIVRTVAATIIASSLLLPATAVTASAQSSLSSGTFDLGMSHDSDPVAVQLEKAFEDYGLSRGHSLDLNAEMRAELLLRSVIKGHTITRNGRYLQLDSASNTLSSVSTVTPKEIQDFLEGINGGERLATSYFSGAPFRFGVAVGVKNGTYYLVTTQFTN